MVLGPDAVRKPVEVDRFSHGLGMSDGGRLTLAQRTLNTIRERWRLGIRQDDRAALRTLYESFGGFDDFMRIYAQHIC